MAEKTKDLVKEIENTRLQISHTLQSCLQSDGKRRSAVGYQQISAFNRRSMPDIVEGLAQEKWYRPRQEVLVGQEVMELSETSEYNVHFPVICISKPCKFIPSLGLKSITDSRPTAMRISK